MSLQAVFWGDAGKENGETGDWHMDVYQKLGNPSVKLSILMDFHRKIGLFQQNNGLFTKNCDIIEAGWLFHDFHRCWYIDGSVFEQTSSFWYALPKCDQNKKKS